MPFARREDHRLHWRREGDPSGPPLVMVMGLAGALGAWYRLTPHLRACDLVVFDHRGTGRSDPVGGPLTMAELVADTLAVMDAAGMRDAHLHGTSMGGMVAQHLALDHRERVRSLCVSCTSPGRLRGQPPWRLFAAGALRPLVGGARAGSLAAPALYGRRTLRDRPERLGQDLEVRLREEAVPRTLLMQLAAIAGHDVRDRLPELAGAPVTVLHGAEDLLVPVAHGREVARLVPGARLVELAGCGHFLTTDADEDYAAVLLEHVAWAEERLAARGGLARPDRGGSASLPTHAADG